MKKKVLLACDGACLGNPGPGGWAALLRYGQKEKLIVGHEAMTTNNRMELTALIEGLKSLKQSCEITIKTDSRYLIDAFEKGWLINWQKNGWKSANNKPVKNQDLWEILEQLLGQHEYTWQWVKGHSGEEDNETVDRAARAAAQDQGGDYP